MQQNIFAPNMVMETKYVDLLLGRVNAEDDMDALLRMLPRIGVDVLTLQSMMRLFICSLGESAARTALFNVKPIDAILPKDVLQNIAAFNHSVRQRLINKSFQKCYDRNSEMVKRMRHQVVKKYKHKFSPEVTHDEIKNKIYVVHPEGENVTTKSLEHEQRVVVNTNLQKCIQNANSGDKILIQDGTYVLRAFSRDWDIEAVTIRNKHLHIIGIGKNVKIKVQGACTPLGRIRGCSLNIEEGSHILFSDKSVGPLRGQSQVIT